MSAVPPFPVVWVATWALTLAGGIAETLISTLGQHAGGGKTLNLLVDNLGNIVQEVVGAGGDALSEIIGNFKVNLQSKALCDMTALILVVEHDRGRWNSQAGWPRSYPEDLQVRCSWLARRHHHKHRRYVLYQSCRQLFANQLNRSSCTSCCSEASRWWKWRGQRRRRIIIGSLFWNPHAGHSSEQTARYCSTVNTPIALALV